MFNKNSEKQSFTLACTVIGTHKNIMKDDAAIIHSHVKGTTCELTRHGRQGILFFGYVHFITCKTFLLKKFVP